jgi:hypothetical protein
MRAVNVLFTLWHGVSLAWLFAGGAYALLMLSTGMFFDASGLTPVAVGLASTAMAMHLERAMWPAWRETVQLAWGGDAGAVWPDLLRALGFGVPCSLVALGVAAELWTLPWPGGRHEVDLRCASLLTMGALIVAQRLTIAGFVSAGAVEGGDRAAPSRALLAVSGVLFAVNAGLLFGVILGGLRVAFA